MMSLYLTEITVIQYVKCIGSFVSFVTDSAVLLRALFERSVGGREVRVKKNSDDHIIKNERIVKENTVGRPISKSVTTKNLASQRYGLLGYRVENGI